MKNVHLITVLSLGYTLLIHTPAFAGNYTQLDLLGFSKDGDCLAYQLSNKGSDPAIFQEKVIILDVNNQKTIKTLTLEGMTNPAISDPAQGPQAEIKAIAPETFRDLYTASLEKERIIEWNKGIAVYQTRLDQAAVYPQLSKEVSFSIKDEKNQVNAYKVIILKQDAKNVDCEHEFLTYSPSLFTCKITNSPWETTLSQPAPEPDAGKEQKKQQSTAQNCFRDFFIQSIYIYKNKVVVFIYAGAPASAASGTAGMNWSILTLLGTLNRTYAVVPDAPVLADVTPSSQFATRTLPRVSFNLQGEPAANPELAMLQDAADEAEGTEAAGTAVSAGTSPQTGREGAVMTVPVAVSQSITLLPVPHLKTIAPNPDYDSDVYLTWDEVPGATAYKVYRELQPITNTMQLKPVTVTSDWYYTDKSPKDKKIYWYAVTAINTPHNSKKKALVTKGNATGTGNATSNNRAEQESLPSRSKSVFINYEPTSLIFWEDFDANNVHETPAGWTTNSNAAGAMWFFSHAAWSLPSLQLIVSDNQDNAGVWGSTDFKSAVLEGWFEFDFKLDKQTIETGSHEQDYILNLKTDNGKEKIIQLRIHNVLARHQYQFILQGASGKNWFNENEFHHIRLAFGSAKLSLQVDGGIEISDVSYNPKPLKQLLIETSASSYGGGCLFDNLALWENKQAKDQKNNPNPPDVHSTPPRAENREELFEKHRLADENMKAETFNQAGFQLYRQNNLQEAMQMFLCAIEQDNNYARGYYNFACMLSLLDEKNSNTSPNANPNLSPNANQETAFRYLESAYRLDPEFVLRAQKDQDLNLLKKNRIFQSLSEKYYYSFNSSDLTIFTEGFARSVRAHRWPDLLNYFDKSYLTEYYGRLYDRKTDLFICDFFELSSLLAFKAKKELSTYLINQIKDCQVVKQTDEAVTFRLLLATETNNSREITVDLKKRTSGNKQQYSFVRYFPPRG